MVGARRCGWAVIVVGGVWWWAVVAIDGWWCWALVAVGEWWCWALDAVGGWWCWALGVVGGGFCWALVVVRAVRGWCVIVVAWWSSSCRGPCRGVAVPSLLRGRVVASWSFVVVVGRRRGGMTWPWPPSSVWWWCDVSWVGKGRDGMGGLTLSSLVVCSDWFTSYGCHVTDGDVAPASGVRKGMGQSTQVTHLNECGR